MSDASRCFVGLDLSLTGTGLSVVRLDGSEEWFSSACVRSTGSRGDTLTDRHQRLTGLVSKILGWVEEFSPNVSVLVEAPAFAKSNSGTWDRAGLWWRVVAALHAGGVELAEMSPTKLKKFATGRGNATKPDMRMALFQRVGADVRDDNEVDAIWLALAAAAFAGENPAGLPKSHLKVLSP